MKVFLVADSAADYFFDKVTEIDEIPNLLEELTKHKPENVIMGKYRFSILTTIGGLQMIAEWGDDRGLENTPKKGRGVMIKVIIVDDHPVVRPEADYRR